MEHPKRLWAPLQPLLLVQHSAITLPEIHHIDFRAVPIQESFCSLPGPGKK